MLSSDVIIETKTHLSGSIKKIQEHRMIQASLEGNFSSREDTLLENKPALTTTDVIILGEDAYSIEPNLDEFSPDFIGPHDATNEARPLLENQAKDLAKVAVMSFEAYGREYRKVATAARMNISQGYLRLNADFPGKNVEQQIDAFVTQQVMERYKPHDEVVADLAVEKAVQNLGSKQPEHELQEKVDKLESDARTRLHGIVRARALLVENGVSPEIIQQFDYTAGLMRVPESEAYERDMHLDPAQETPGLVDTSEIRLLDMFKNVLSSSFGRKTLHSIGILSPKSREIEIVDHKRSTTR